VDLSSINLDDKTYSIRPERDQPDKNLIRSISKFGILHPPLIKSLRDNTYVVLSGWKRIAAIKRIDSKRKVTCLVANDTVNEPHLFLLLLHHALIGEGLSIIEIAIFLKKITRLMSKQDVLMFLPFLGMKPHMHNLDDTLCILTLDRSVILASHNGLISNKILSRLQKLSQSDQKAVCEFIINLKLSASNQVKFIELCIELSMKTNRSASEILKDWPGNKLYHQPSNKPQQASSLLDWLYSLCYPKINEAEKSFKHFVKTLNLPKQAEIQHTPSFEDDSVSLTLAFENRDSLLAAWKKIAKFLQHQS